MTGHDRGRMPVPRGLLQAHPAACMTDGPATCLRPYLSHHRSLDSQRCRGVTGRRAEGSTGVAEAAAAQARTCARDRASATCASVCACVYVCVRVVVCACAMHLCVRAWVVAWQPCACGCVRRSARAVRPGEGQSVRYDAIDIDEHVRSAQPRMPQCRTQYRPSGKCDSCPVSATAHNCGTARHGAVLRGYCRGPNKCTVPPRLPCPFRMLLGRTTESPHRRRGAARCHGSLGLREY